MCASLSMILTLVVTGSVLLMYVQFVCMHVCVCVCVCVRAHVNLLHSLHVHLCFISCRSKTFRPVYANIGEIRAVVPSGTPMVAFTATATRAIRYDVLVKLEMCDSKFVHISPNRSNIYFEVRPRTTIEADMAPIVHDLRANQHKAQRVLIYCRSLNMCADLYAHFCYELGEKGSYYPENAEHVSDNRLYGMYHAKSPSHNKDVILKSMLDANGVVRVVFCTVALGMGVNFAGLNHIIHYGAPSSIEDYYQECGRAGRSGEQAKSVIYWIPADAPLRKNLGNPTNAEIATVRHFLENSRECRRDQLLKYFDASCSCYAAEQDPVLCCDVCACKALSKE